MNFELEHYLSTEEFISKLKETTTTRTWYIDADHQGIRSNAGECPICAVINDMNRSPLFFQTNFYSAQAETYVRVEDDDAIVNAADHGGSHSQRLRDRMIDILNLKTKTLVW